MSTSVKDSIIELIKDGHDEGRITIEEAAEIVDLLRAGRDKSTFDQQRLTELLDKCGEPPADPETVGFTSVDRDGRTPRLAIYGEYVAFLMESPGATPKSTERHALAVGSVDFGKFFNIDMAAVGGPLGWIGYVTDGVILSRSTDLFGSVDDAERWCRSIIERETGKQ